MISIAVTGEREGEPRVAVSPETVKRLTALGCTVRVQAGAGAGSRFSDAILEAQGATIAGSAAEALSGADILLKVRRPSPEEVAALKPGAGVVTTRGHVHWVVTEYGAVNLHGLTLRQRGEALIAIAHPDVRAELSRDLAEIRRLV